MEVFQIYQESFGVLQTYRKRFEVFQIYQNSFDVLQTYRKRFEIFQIYQNSFDGRDSSPLSASAQFNFHQG